MNLEKSSSFYDIKGELLKLTDGRDYTFKFTQEPDHPVLISGSGVHSVRLKNRAELPSIELKFSKLFNGEPYLTDGVSHIMTWRGNSINNFNKDKCGERNCYCSNLVLNRLTRSIYKAVDDFVEGNINYLESTVIDGVGFRYSVLNEPANLEKLREAVQFSIIELYNLIKTDVVLKLVSAYMLGVEHLESVSSSDTIIDEYIINLLIWKLNRLGERLVGHRYATESYLPIFLEAIAHYLMKDFRLCSV